MRKLAEIIMDMEATMMKQSGCKKHKFVIANKPTNIFYDGKVRGGFRVQEVACKNCGWSKLREPLEEVKQ